MHNKTLEQGLKKKRIMSSLIIETYFKVISIIKSHYPLQKVEIRAIIVIIKRISAIVLHQIKNY